LREFLKELSSPLPYAPPPFLSSTWLRTHVWSYASELEENSTYRTLSGCQISSPNISSSAALMDWTRRSHGAPCVCEYYEVLHVWYYVGAPVLLHWQHGTVALLRQDLHDLEVGYIVFIVNACAGA
jgi:hypothetical protein